MDFSDDRRKDFMVSEVGHYPVVWQHKGVGLPDRNEQAFPLYIGDGRQSVFEERRGFYYIEQPYGNRRLCFPELHGVVAGVWIHARGEHWSVRFPELHFPCGFGRRGDLLSGGNRNRERGFLRLHFTTDSTRLPESASDRSKGVLRMRWASRDYWAWPCV